MAMSARRERRTCHYVIESRADSTRGVAKNYVRIDILLQPQALYCPWTVSMNASFSQYASRFLNNRTLADSSQASLPLFYSFHESEEGESLPASRLAQQETALSRDDLELDEHGEPRLRGDEELEDPYLRLDEEEDNNDTNTILKASLPLIGSIEPSTQGGWLAHQISPLPSRTPTPSTSPPTPPAATTTHLALTESLLPRDSVSRSAFFLPEPGRTPLFKYNDTNWTILWCTAFTICCIASVFSFFVTSVSFKATVFFNSLSITFRSLLFLHHTQASFVLCHF